MKTRPTEALSYLDDVTQFREQRLDSKFLLQKPGQRQTAAILAMSQHHPWMLRRETTEPLKQFRLGRVRAESTEAVRRRPHGNGVAENRHFHRAFHKLAS